jgi:opacity protein-like surface antigen
MKAFKLQYFGIVLAAACLLVPIQASAQWSLGASYEVRDEDPTNGFGLRVERDILRPVPIVDIGLRAHFSYFNDENDFTRDNQIISGDFTYYDYGLAATGGFSLGLLKPYIGLGIGNSNFKREAEDDAFDDSDNNIFWNSFIGVELTPIPKLNPFIEYRFQPTDEADFAPSSDGRLIIGLSLSF